MVDETSTTTQLDKFVLVVLRFLRTFGLEGTRHFDHSLECVPLPLKTSKYGLLWSECNTRAVAHAITAAAKLGKLEGGGTESVCKEFDLSLANTGIIGVFVRNVLPCAARDPQEATAGKTVSFSVVPLGTTILTQAAILTNDLLEEVEFVLETSSSGGGRQLSPRLCEGLVRP